MNAQQNQLQAQQSAGMVSAGVGLAGSAATAGAAMAALTCWVAQAAYGTDTNHWKTFRHWLMNKGPKPLRTLYLRKGRAFAPVVRKHPALRILVRFLMNQAVKSMTYETFSFA